MKYVYLLYIYDSEEGERYLEGAFAGKDVAESVARALGCTENKGYWIQELEVRK